MQSAQPIPSKSREPLVLLHGISGSASMWNHVLPRLAHSHRALALTALGHRGGRSPTRRPVRIADVVDDAERSLDELRIQRAHLVGNSMGGWVALELARRGRAQSVCALSPAGMWTNERKQGATRKLSQVAARARLGRPFLPLLAHSADFRRWALRANALHGERVSRAELLQLADDMLGCVAFGDLLRTDERLDPLPASSIPVTVAWSEHDRVFPPAAHLRAARSLIPWARFMTLPGVGHVPMLDDPELVARTILGAIRPA
jgi:pimeloyl-ACP methyl ester carboxylesterase